MNDSIVHSVTQVSVAEQGVFQSTAVGPGRVFIHSARCPGVEKQNEDAAIAMDIAGNRAVLAVADGMGGLPAGAQASQIALAELAKHIEAHLTTGNDLRSAILDGIEAANEAVMEKTPGGGTTLAVLEINSNQARPYHVGDSSILRVGGQGKRLWQSIAHSPVGYALAAGVLEEQEAIHHEERHLISNMVGSREMGIEIGPPLTLKRRDTVLLATDGVTDNLFLEEIVETIRKGRMKEVAKNLAEACQERMHTPHEKKPSKPDDCTFTLFRLA